MSHIRQRQPSRLSIINLRSYLSSITHHVPTSRNSNTHKLVSQHPMAAPHRNRSTSRGPRTVHDAPIAIYRNEQHHYRRAQGEFKSSPARILPSSMSKLIMHQFRPRPPRPALLLPNAKPMRSLSPSLQPTRLPARQACAGHPPPPLPRRSQHSLTPSTAVHTSLVWTPCRGRTCHA